jgi:hypothetical protein
MAQPVTTAATSNNLHRPIMPASLLSWVPVLSVYITAHHPRPINGIFVAITVMNWTFTSSGNPAM